MAKSLEKKLKKALPKLAIETVATEYAGHARELAYEIANKHSAPLIISASGDGGYNEVINGAMDSENKEVICAVLPAGNANDHSRTMQDNPLHKQIIKGKTIQLDLIKVTAKDETGEKVSRYAHSYVGLGLTPAIAVELNRHSLNPIKEILLVIKTFRTYHPFQIRRNDRILKLNNLVFANTNQMAKFLTLAPKNRPDDGMFEVIVLPTLHRWTLVKQVAQAAIKHLDPARRLHRYLFTTVEAMPIQLDGEVMQLKANTHVTIESMHKMLRTVV